MNVTQVTDELKKIELLKGLILNEPEPESQFGYIKVEPKHFLDKDKNEIKLDGTYSLFVAHMYKDRITYSDMEEFFYLIFSHRGTQRDYRRHKHNTHRIEYNKIFASGKTVEEIVSNFKEKIKNYSLI